MAEREGRSEDTRVTLARQRWVQAEKSEDKQRERERADLQFYAGDQWDEGALKARAAQQALQIGTTTLPPVPARPALVINKVREPVKQVTNQERGSDFGVELVAADDFGDLDGDDDETEIELREGLNRRIQRAPEAEDARLWAGSRAAQAGRGFYGVMTRYLPGKTFDQEVYIRRFYNQFSVLIDPAHEMPDGSDALWGFVGVDMPIAQYEAEYGTLDGKHNRVCKCDDSEWRALGNEAPDWFAGEGDTRSVRVVEYWYTELKPRTLVKVGGQAFWKDELPKDAPIDKDSARTVVERQIAFCKLDGVQVLDETDWPGPDLPIIKVLGEELHPYDAERRVEGMVRPMRDAGQAFNAVLSKFVETLGSAPLPPWQATLEQIEGFEAFYQMASTRAIPVLPYNAKTEQGELLPPPTRTPMGSDVQALAVALQICDEAIQSTTGVPEARVGKNTARRDQSGKALQEQRESSEQGTSNYQDNLKRSIRYEGQIINNLLYPIYGTPGRLARILTKEGESETVMINAPEGAPQKPGRKTYTLTPDANFNVVVKVSRAYDTRRQQEVTTIAELLGANPLFMTWFGDLFFKNQDGPGHLEMAERAKVMLDPKIQAMLDAKKQGQEPDPQQLLQALAQKDAQLQEAEGLLNQAHQEIKSKLAERQMDNDTKIKIAQLDFEKDVLLQKMKDATEIAKARIAAASKGLALDAHAAEEAQALGLQEREAERTRQHEQDMAQRGQMHEAGMQAADVDVEAQEAEAQRQHDLTMGEQAHGQTLEAQAQAAALAPQPEAGAE